MPHDQKGETALMEAATIRWERAIRQHDEAVDRERRGFEMRSTTRAARPADRAAQSGYIERAKLLIDSGNQDRGPGCIYEERAEQRIGARH